DGSFTELPGTDVPAAVQRNMKSMLNWAKKLFPGSGGKFKTAIESFDANDKAIADYDPNDGDKKKALDIAKLVDGIQAMAAKADKEEKDKGGRAGNNRAKHVPKLLLELDNKIVGYFEETDYSKNAAYNVAPLADLYLTMHNMYKWADDWKYKEHRGVLHIYKFIQQEKPLNGLKLSGNNAKIYVAMIAASLSDLFLKVTQEMRQVKDIKTVTDVQNIYNLRHYALVVYPNNIDFTKKPNIDGKENPLYEQLSDIYLLTDNYKKELNDIAKTLGNYFLSNKFKPKANYSVKPEDYYRLATLWVADRKLNGVGAGMYKNHDIGAKFVETTEKNKRLLNVPNTNATKKDVVSYFNVLRRDPALADFEEIIEEVNAYMPATMYDKKRADGLLKDLNGLYGKAQKANVHAKSVPLKQRYERQWSSVLYSLNKRIIDYLDNANDEPNSPYKFLKKDDTYALHDNVHGVMQAYINMHNEDALAWELHKQDGKVFSTKQDWKLLSARGMEVSTVPTMYSYVNKWIQSKHINDTRDNSFATIYNAYTAADMLDSVPQETANIKKNNDVQAFVDMNDAQVGYKKTVKGTNKYLQTALTKVYGEEQNYTKEYVGMYGKLLLYFNDPKTEKSFKQHSSASAGKYKRLALFYYLDYKKLAVKDRLADLDKAHIAKLFNERDKKNQKFAEIKDYNGKIIIAQKDVLKYFGITPRDPNLD
ncbi:hypothetical protein HOF51_00120, partial [bacterium]|nr:hypothetical protein [bacterium]